MHAARNGPTTSRPTLLLLLYLLIALGFVSLLARGGATAAATPQGPFIVSRSGPQGEDVTLIDLRTGTVLNRVPNQGEAAMQVFLAPTGTVAAVLTVEGEAPLRQILEFRTVPDWTLRTRLALDTVPPLRQLDDTTAGTLRDPWLYFVAFTPDAEQVILAFFTSGEVEGFKYDVPHLVVTSFDLTSHQWANWAQPLGPADYAWLLPLHDRFLVVARSFLPFRTGYLAKIYALDRNSGAVLGEQPIHHPRPALLPFQNSTVPSTTAGIEWAALHGSEVILLTTDIARIVVDTTTLRVERIDPPLTRTLTARSAVLLPEHLVVQSKLDELMIVDLGSWTIRSTHRLPRPDPEAPWIFYWVLLGADPSRPWIYLVDLRDECVRRWDLAAQELSAPVACGLHLPYELITYHGWPVFSPGVSEAQAASATPTHLGTRTLTMTTLALGTTFILSVASAIFVLLVVRRPWHGERAQPRPGVVQTDSS